MKKYIIFILAFCLFSSIQAQEIKGKSDNYSFYISKDPPKPPYLTIVENSLQFTDNDGNKMIDANESTHIKFQIHNDGQGDGLSLKAVIKETYNIQGLNFNSVINLGTLKKGETKIIEIPIQGKMQLKDGTAGFSITIEEANGFGIDPVFIEVSTRAFQNPVVKIIDYTVTSQSGSVLLKKKPFEVQLLIQNVGQGNAENVNVILTVPANMFCLSGNQTENIDNLAPGSTKIINYSLIATNKYTVSNIPLKFNLNERYNKYGETKTIELALNQAVSTSKLTVQGQERKQTEITVASLSSEIDKNIPCNPVKNPNRYALIIGNENYQSYQTGLSSEMNVEFACNDASIFKKYAERTLGIEQGNIYFLTDATAGKMNQNIELVTKIIKKIGGNAELIFYYAGHGFPDEKTKIPYLMPVDVNATDLSMAIKLSDVYKKFSECGAKRITVFLDACFSGGGRESGLLAARGVKIKPKENTISGNMVVFTASSEEQSALPYKKKQHGMFTYFLLKKIQDTGGDVTYGELSEYINNKVSIESLKVNRKEQDPKVNISNDVINDWEGWRMK